MSGLVQRVGRLRVVVVLTALVVLTSAMGTTLALTRPPLSSAETALAERPGPAAERDAGALAVASEAARLALTYDHRELGPGLRAATATMTGEFAHAFADSFRRDFVPTIRRTDATSEATVRGVGLVRSRAGRAVVLVLVDQVRHDDTTGASGASGASTSWRLAVDVTWTGADDGAWRVDDLRSL